MSRIMSGFVSQVGAVPPPPRVISNQEQVFLYELLMSDEERRLYNAVMNSPDDITARQMYSDFLNERGRVQSAQYILAGVVPGCVFTWAGNGGIRSGFGSAWGSGAITGGIVR